MVVQIPHANRERVLHIGQTRGCGRCPTSELTSSHKVVTVKKAQKCTDGRLRWAEIRYLTGFEHV